MSGVLYADLYNQDGYLVERQQVELRNGQAHGSFLLPDSLYSGYYELRAYTRWMLNWGITDHPHTKMAEQYGMDIEMVKKYLNDEQVRDELISRKAIEVVTSSAKAKKARKTTKKTTKKAEKEAEKETEKDAE